MLSVIYRIAEHYVANWLALVSRELVVVYILCVSLPLVKYEGGGDANILRRYFLLWYSCYLAETFFNLIILLFAIYVCVV